MKQFSRETAKKHDEALLGLRRSVKQTMEDSIMNSKTFADDWEPYIRDIALFKENKGRKYFRSQEYASVGVMDRNDLMQEAYLAFFNAYEQVNWRDIEKSKNPEAELWSYLKKRTILDTNIAIRNNKDGMRITQYGIFQSKEAKESENIKAITSLFSQIDKVFFTNQEDTATTKWSTDLLGYFLETKMDVYLDVKSTGERNLKGIERDVIKRCYGIDTHSESLREIGAVSYTHLTLPTILRV